MTKFIDGRQPRDNDEAFFASFIISHMQQVPTLAGSRSSTGVGWDSGESLIDD
jgi:hypothetical protein